MSLSGRIVGGCDTPRQTVQQVMLEILEIQLKEKSAKVAFADDTSFSSHRSDSFQHNTCGFLCIEKRASEMSGKCCENFMR